MKNDKKFGWEIYFRVSYGNSLNDTKKSVQVFQYTSNPFFGFKGIYTQEQVDKLNKTYSETPKPNWSEDRGEAYRQLEEFRSLIKSVL